MKNNFPLFTQLDAMDCGPTCLRMIARHYGRHYSLDTLRQKSYLNRSGVSLLGISTAAENIGFKSLGVRLDFEKLCEAPLPCIVHWKQNHFVVVYDIVKKRRETTVCVADPAGSRIRYTAGEFIASWAGDQRNDTPEGIALLLEPTPDFYAAEGEKKRQDQTALCPAVPETL